MKIDNSIDEVRNSGSKLSKSLNGRIPVIVLTIVSKDCSTYGIQFWTPEMIEVGNSKNTDNTISTFVENL